MNYNGCKIWRHLIIWLSCSWVFTVLEKIKLYNSLCKDIEPWKMYGKTHNSQMLNASVLNYTTYTLDSASRRSNHKNFLQRIPREEVEMHSNIVLKAAKKLDKDIQITTVGSYHRGAQTCGEVAPRPNSLSEGKTATGGTWKTDGQMLVIELKTSGAMWRTVWRPRKARCMFPGGWF